MINFFSYIVVFLLHQDSCKSCSSQKYLEAGFQNDLCDGMEVEENQDTLLHHP